MDRNINSVARPGPMSHLKELRLAVHSSADVNIILGNLPPNFVDSKGMVEKQ